MAKLEDISKEQLDRIDRLKEVVDIGQTSSWAVHQHPFPCLTRWKDLWKSQKVAIGNWPALMILKARLITNGGGPPARKLTAASEEAEDGEAEDGGTEATEDSGTDGKAEDDGAGSPDLRSMRSSALLRRSFAAPAAVGRISPGEPHRARPVVAQ